MNFSDDAFQEGEEVGSDELLSAEELRLPESASMLVRLHAVRAWLTRRQSETELEIGEAALALQTLQMNETTLRRREREALSTRVQQFQQSIHNAQERLRGFQEAEAEFEESVAHTTSGERSLVEYYLVLEDLLQTASEGETRQEKPWLEAIEEVQRRIEHVGTPTEE